MLMLPRRIYILSFIVLAATFLPVFVNALFAGGIMPVSAMWVFGGPIVLIYGPIDLVVFYVAARLSLWVSTILPSRPVQIAFRYVCLAALFSTSFARVNEMGDFRGRTGAYTFWGGIHRCVERQSENGGVH